MTDPSRIPDSKLECEQSAGVPMTVLWAFIVAIWGSGLIDRSLDQLFGAETGEPPLSEWAIQRLNACIRKPIGLESVARRRGDYRPDRQISKDNRLVFAIEEEDEEKARQALATGANPNGRFLDVCGHGWTPLMEASSLGHKELVDLLLAHGARPDLGYDGETPLSLAIREGHTEVVHRLVAAGARKSSP